MDKNSIHQKHEIVGIVIKANGRTVGQVIDRVFVKDVSKKKHFLNFPEAIAYSLDTLYAAERAGAEYLDVLDTDTNTHYRASLAMMWDKGRNFDYGYEAQRYLCLSHWQTFEDPQATHETAPPEYSESSGTHEEVKPLHYTSHAPKGVTYKKSGKRTMKQMALFGGAK